MENIKKIYIKEDGTPLYTHYNGSWNVMKMETTDGLDYSYSISEMIDDRVWEYEDEEGIELEGQEYMDFVKAEFEFLADSFGWELVRADWFMETESKFHYLQDEMMNTTCVCDYIFKGAEKPHFTKIWKEVSENNNQYTMEDIHKIIYGYNNTTEFAFIMSLDTKFYDKVEKMKFGVENWDNTEKLWEMLENNFGE